MAFPLKCQNDVVKILLRGETDRTVPRNEITNFICPLSLPQFRKKFNIVLHLQLHAVLAQCIILW